MEERSRADGARTFTTWCWEDDTLRVGVVTKRGYREERRQRFWELDLFAERAKLEAPAAEMRAKMRGQKIRVLTVDRDPDPDQSKKLSQLSQDAIHDIPTTLPDSGTSFAGFM